MNVLEKITVIVPVYNTEKYLHRCIDSILGQEHRALEIILINDGSTDNSGKVCDEYAKKDERIKVIHQKNQGQSVARNVGLENATGHYITYVDSDDWIDLEMYATMMKVMKDHSLEVVECNEIHRYEDTEIKPVDPGTLVFEDRLTAVKRVVLDESFSVCKRIYSKETLKGMKFLVGTFAEDVYFTLNYILKIERLAVLSNPFYNYYKANESTTRGTFRLRSLGTIDAALYVEKTIPDALKDDELKANIRKFILTVLLYNYKAIQRDPQVDTNLEHRKRLKQMIGQYYESNLSNAQLKIAKILPVRLYATLSQVNKLIQRS